MDAHTFDDVLLVPAYNHHTSRRDVTTQVTDKTGKLKLDLPVISSNMDTITESEMANFMGKHQVMYSSGQTPLLSMKPTLLESLMISTSHYWTNISVLPVDLTQ